MLSGETQSRAFCTTFKATSKSEIRQKVDTRIEPLHGYQK